MNTVTTRRWRVYSCLAAGLLVLAALASRCSRDDMTEESTPAAGDSDQRARQAAERRIASRQLAGQRATAELRRRDEPRARVERLSDLQRNPEDDRALWTAQEDLIAACMRDRGFTYVPNPFDDDSAPDPTRPRVSETVESARAHGYGLAASIANHDRPKAMVDANEESLSHMSPDRRDAFLEALRGPAVSPADPTVRHLVERVPLPGGGSAYWYRGSCLARARHQLYGDDYEHNELGYAASILRAELLAEADTDPAYRTGVEAWRACMRGRHFDEELPRSAANHLARDYRQKKLSLDELRAQEVAIATADVECTAQADIDRIRRDAETRAEDKLAAEHREQLLAMKQVRDEALDRANRLLAETAR